ncbi:VanZ family protein [Paenibacillus sp. sptzw28]|nr:VanZ family protein [Paenibacillus sp. sptzw28]
MQLTINVYLIPIRYALVTFPVLAFFFTLPFLIVQYRKYAYINKVRLVVLYSLLLYLLTAYYLVILPLPATRHTCTGLQTTFISLVPFQFIRDIVKETQVDLANPLTYWRLFRERAFLQAAFNVALLVPLGIFLRYYFRRKAWVAVILAFLLSLFFETTQLTGLYGFYDCPYRLFDVDDIMLNTTGGIVGYMIAPYLTRFLPDSARLDEQVDLSVKKIGFIRRWVAFQLDAFILYPFVIAALFTGELFYLYFLLIMYFMLLPFMTNGRTFGKWVVRIQLQGKGNRIAFKELFVRYGILYMLIGGANLLAVDVSQWDASRLFKLFVLMMTIGIDLSFCIHVLLKVFRKDKTMFYEKWSGTRHVIVTHYDRFRRGG